MNCIKCQKEIPPDGLFCPYCGKKQIVTPARRRKRPNGTGSIYKKPGRAKPWEAQKNGVYIGSFITRREAEEALAQLRDVRTTDCINITFAQVYEKWSPEHFRTISRNGIANYRAAFAKAAPLHSRPFRSLRTEDFQSVIDAMEAGGMSLSSCQKAVQLFSQLSKWAIREEVCRTNFAQFVTISAVQKSTRMVFTPEQIHAILSSDHRAAQIASILLATGCRPNELFSARLENCHDNYFISGSKTKAGRNRVIPVAPFGLAAYQKLLEAARASGGDLLINGYSGSRTFSSFSSSDWRGLMESLGLSGFTPYCCRHTFSTLAVRSGVRPELLQKIMGHVDYSTTLSSYTHLDADDILSAAGGVIIEPSAVTGGLQANSETPAQK